MDVRKTLCLAIAAVALAASGCGGDDEIPADERLPPDISRELMRQLESVDDRVAAGVSGACDDIYASASDDGNIEPIEATLASVPPRVDARIRSALERSVERLKQLVDEECAAIRADEQGEEGDPVETETAPETTPTETAPPETETAPETTPTETDPPDTETTPTPPARPPATSPGRGPDGNGPPGQNRGGAEAPDEDDD